MPHPRCLAAAILLALALLLCSVATASAANSHRKHRPKPSPTSVPEPAAQRVPTKHTVQPAPRIPLQRNLRFVLRPTLLGLVPPPDPLDMGEAYLRVLGVDAERVVVRYELKEQVAQDPATGMLYPLAQAPSGVQTKPLLRIRRGDVEARRSGAEPGIVSPLLWATGDWKTRSGLLWIDPDILAKLKAGQQPEWNVEGDAGSLPADTADDGGYKQAVEVRRAASGLDAVRADGRLPLLSLKLFQAGAAYRCLVNGATVDLPAVRALDSELLAEYWFLDDPANPLLLKMNYLPLKNPDPAESGWAGVINSGGGFAVTEIDF